MSFKKVPNEFNFKNLFCLFCEDLGFSFMRKSTEPFSTFSEKWTFFDSFLHPHADLSMHGTLI